MATKTDSQIEDWLNKLERESWQLELLVSAFTIFLLIGATSQFDDFVTDIQHRYNVSSGGVIVGFVFLYLLEQALKAMTIFLVAHLLLRGFWIGTIGLRSVQSSINFKNLNYSEFFTEKLKKKVISLDQLVIRLDEICSVIFAFAFMVIFILLSFGLYVVLIGVFGFFVNTLSNITPDSWDTFIAVFTLICVNFLILSGLVYLIDFFTLGFFKKFRWMSKIYYPFYWFYSYVTLAFLSRSIYYYMISKFSKKRIRVVFSLGIILIASTSFFEFDHHPYFPEDTNERFVSTNMYDDLREANSHVSLVSIPSRYIDKPFFQVFIRYNPNDNELVKAKCPDFELVRKEGLNPKFMFETGNGNLLIKDADYSAEEFDQMLSCLASIFQISVNDSIYTELSHHFYVHPVREQEGLLVTVPTRNFLAGENLLEVRKLGDTDSLSVFSDYAFVPFWFNKN